MCSRVGIVAAVIASIAGEAGLWDICIDGVVLAGAAGDGHLQHVDRGHRGLGDGVDDLAVAGQEVVLEVVDLQLRGGRSWKMERGKERFNSGAINRELLGVVARNFGFGVVAKPTCGST